MPPPLLRVLLVEDDPNDALLVQRLLKDVATVDVAIRKDQFVALLKEHWDVLVLDWRVNDLSGEESVELAKGASSDVPLILLTGSLDEASSTAALRLGFSDYLKKDRMDRLPHAIQQAHERRLLHQQAMRDNRLEILGHLTAGFLHDWNQILQVFLSGPEILRRIVQEELGNVPETVNRILGVMDSTGRRGAEMSKQIAAFIRGSNGTSMKVVAPEFLLTELRAMLRESFPQSIKVTTKAAVGTDPVRCDPVQLGQVLLNLAVNARDAMMPGGGELRVTAQNVLLADGKPNVQIQVYDTGPGIPADVLPHIFEAFYTTKKAGQGTGLGLAMAQKIMRDHGGDIEVRPSPHGTSFFLYLPVARDETRAEAVTRMDDFNGGGKLVVVCDDEAHMRLMIEMFLRDANYKVLLAANGMEALSCFRSNHNVEALLTDVHMPHFGGANLLSALRSQNYTLPVIFLTGQADAAVNSFHPKPTAVLTKPFTKGALLSALQRVLDGGVPTGAP
jgi:two-component system cell cycle sensor histidine kinase/response regulator CckA